MTGCRGTQCERRIICRHVLPNQRVVAWRRRKSKAQSSGLELWSNHLPLRT